MAGEDSKNLVPVVIIGLGFSALAPLIPLMLVASLMSGVIGTISGIVGAAAGASTSTAGAICDPTAEAGPSPSAGQKPSTARSSAPSQGPQPSPQPGPQPSPSPGPAASPPPTGPAHPASTSFGGGGPTAISAGVAKTYGLSAEQINNAAVIISVGQQKNVPVFGLVIAVATALQESSLINSKTATDHDSLGLFQQRPSQGWGTPEQVTDPVYAAGAFYDHLLKVKDWQSMSLTDAAQAVQRSGFPDAYAKWENEARDIVGQDSGAACPTLGSGSSQTIIQAASKWLDQIPYSWGGGDANGPTKGQCEDGDCSAENVVGFDCSGLALYAYAQIGITLPHSAYDQYKMLKKIPRDQLQPGDLLFYATDPSQPTTIHHVAIFLGGDQMIEAAHTGTKIRITTGIWTDTYYAKQFVSGGRP